MVQYVGVEHLVGLIREAGIREILRGMAGYIEADFRRWEAFEKTPRVASHSRHGVIELMPTSDGSQFGFKYVNGHPRNTLRGMQTVTAFGVLSDVESGYPRFLSEMTITTALRTAATSALAARYLARRDARSMALIGLGAQSEFQALAFQALLGIDRLRVHDIDAAATRKFLANLGDQGFEIEVFDSPRKAVSGADIVTTVTADKQRAAILSNDMILEGVHINAVGGDCPGKTELHPDLVRRAEVFVEFPEQTRIEGEIQQMEPDFPVTEIWRVIAGQTQGRKNASQITLFDSVGFATEDFSALRYISDLVQGTRFFAQIDLLAEPEDPRDLFGLLRPGMIARRASTGLAA